MADVEGMSDLELAGYLELATEEALTIADRIVEPLTSEPLRMPLVADLADYRDARLLMQRIRRVRMVEVGGRG